MWSNATQVMETIYIYGRHAVTEALKARPDVVKSLWLKSAVFDNPVFMKLTRLVPDVKDLSQNKIPRGIEKEAVHQGFIAEIDNQKLIQSFRDFKRGLSVSSDTALVVLGEIQDIHNVGAIIRSAAAFGATAVLIPEHRQAPLSGAAFKASAGMAFKVPLVSVKNINAALRDLKEMDFWIYGLDSAGDTELPNEDFKKPSVFVVGNEGKGIREKTKEHCDTVLTIPMHPRSESLNASVSAATVLYAWSVKHPDSLK